MRLLGFGRSRFMAMVADRDIIARLVAAGRIPVRCG
jgi:hypothetical protein